VTAAAMDLLFITFWILSYCLRGLVLGVEK
jgi:hypothetical protein